MVMVYIIYLDICFEPTEVHNTEASSYDQWLPTWHLWVTPWYNSNRGLPHTNPTQQSCLATSFTRLPVPRFIYSTQYILPVRLVWWHIFLQSWNGYSILRHPALLIPPDFTAQTDASGIWGCALVLETEWSQWQRPSEWLSMGIMAKELVPILFTCVTWGNKLYHHSISFQCDSESLIAAIKKKASKDALVMHLLRCFCFWFFIMHFDIPLQPPLLTTSHVET